MATEEARRKTPGSGTGQTVHREADDYLWNSAAGILNAGQSVFMLMVITRVCGIEAAGVFSIAFATANLMLNFGNFGVRNYQVSDLRENYSFKTYLAHRALTTLLMLAAAGIYTAWTVLAGSYKREKALIVLAMCALKAVDCMEDVLVGRLQQRGHLDLGGKMILMRLLVSLAAMITALFVTRDLLVSTVLAILAAVLSLLVMFLRYRRVIREVPVLSDTGGVTRTEMGQGSRQGLWSLTIACFPVCAANVLAFYLTNSPKYAIDALMSETAQAQYNFIAMPVFVIQLLNQFLYQPLLVRMTIAWERTGEDTGKATDPRAEQQADRSRARSSETFGGLILRMLAGLLIITGVVLAGGWLLGIPVLSMLYATDLTALKTELMLLLLGGAFLALSGFLIAVLTITRSQDKIPLAYLIAVLLSLWLMPRMVRTRGLCGAATGYLLIMILVSVLLSGLFLAAVRKKTKKSRGETC